MEDLDEGKVEAALAEEFDDVATSLPEDEDGGDE
jgi:hypothetical protein